MSYQNQQMPSQNAPTSVPAQQMQRAPLVNSYPNGPIGQYPPGLKQQYLPPQMNHTNGLDNSRNVSPALNQPLNAAHLPPATSNQSRPNVYGSALPPSSAVSSKPPSFAPPLLTATVSAPSQIQPSAALAATAAPPPPAATAAATTTQSRPNFVPPPTSISSQNYQENPSVAKLPPPTTIGAPIVPTPSSQPPNNLTHVDKVTTNLQNIHLNNGNGIPNPTQSNPYNQIPASHSPQIITANRLTNGNTTTQQQLSPIPGATNLPPPSKSLTPNVGPPLTNSFTGQPNQQIPLIQQQKPPQQFQQQPQLNNQQQYQHQQQQYQPQFNGLPGAGPIPNKFPPTAPVPNLASNSTIGKRPLYPATQQQQQQPQQQQPPPLLNNVTNSAYNQYQQPPMPQNYPQSMPPTPLNNQAYVQQHQQQPQPYGNSVIQRGFDSMWGHNTIDLMQHRHILPTVPVEPPKIALEHQFYESVNCSPE